MSSSKHSNIFFVNLCGKVKDNRSKLKINYVNFNCF